MQRELLLDRADLLINPDARVRQTYMDLWKQIDAAERVRLIQMAGTLLFLFVIFQQLLIVLYPFQEFQ